MSKSEYTELFERFWKAYPRKVSKAPAFKAWQKQVDESDAFLPTMIIGDIEKRTRLRWWAADKSKIPHAATWINQRRWEDEDWEDDIKTRGQEQGPVNSGAVNYTPIESEYDFDHWQTMQNRMMRNYIWKLTFAIRKITDVQLQRLIQIKNDTYAEVIEAVREEVHGAKDKRVAKAEMAQMIVETMLMRFDQFLGVEISERVIEHSRRIRQQQRAKA